MATTTHTAADRSGSNDRSSADDAYDVRLYERGDGAAFRPLHEQIFGNGGDEWFRWKYERNPYVDHVPIVVATCDGELVACKPCFVLALRAGGETLRGYQPADVMVHPDHRRRGLYSRTTEYMKEYYRDRDASLFFNFPNPATLSGSLKHGWKIVEAVPTYYRIQRPDALLEASDHRSTLSPLARPFAATYLRFRDARAPRSRNVRVERTSDIPIETFVDLYHQSVPDTFHAAREETFYEWRFGNPHWEYDAYLATRAGEPIAGVITGTGRQDGSLVTCLTDVVPLEETPARDDGLRAILQRVIEDHDAADLLTVSGRTIDPSLLAQCGFLSDQSLPLSLVSLATTQVAYPVADSSHEWTVAGRALADPSNWTITFAEQDTR